MDKVTDRDRLIELVDKAKEEYANDITDHTETDYIVECLLNDGWIRPPCKVGDKVWRICRNRETLEWYICEEEVYSIQVCKESIHVYVTPIISFAEMEIGVRLFLTKEEAEEKLKELSNNA